MKFGFVILNYLNYSDVIELLSSISLQSWSNDIHIYIVDNASPNDSVEKLQSAILDYDMDIYLIVADKNDGFAKGENLAINQAKKDKCDFIVSVNSDIVFPSRQDDFLSVFQQQYEKDNSIAIITPNITRADGCFQNPMQAVAPSFFKKFMLKIFFYSRLNWLYYFIRIFVMFPIFTKLGQWRDAKNRSEGIKKGLQNSGPIYAAHGSLQVFTPKYFEYFIGHDEQVFMYCEEYIKAEVLQQCNLKIWFENSIHVSHKTSKSVEMMTKSNKQKIKFILLNMMRSCHVYTKMLKLLG